MSYCISCPFFLRGRAEEERLPRPLSPRCTYLSPGNCKMFVMHDRSCPGLPLNDQSYLDSILQIDISHFSSATLKVSPSCISKHCSRFESQSSILYHLMPMIRPDCLSLHSKYLLLSPSSHAPCHSRDVKQRNQLSYLCSPSINSIRCIAEHTYQITSHAVQK